MIDLFTTQRKCLILLGNQFVHVDSSIMKIVHVCVLIFCASAQWPLINNVVYHKNNVYLATSSLSICFTNFLSVVKIATFICYKWRFGALMTQLETMYQESKDSVAKKILEDAYRRAVVVVKMYLIAVCNSSIYFLMSPLLKIAKSKIFNSQTVLEVPMAMRFDFNFETFPGYAFAYIYVVAVTVIVSLYTISIDGIFIAIATYLVSHLKILQKAIQENTLLKPEDDLKNDLKSHVEYHNLILSLNNELRDIYHPIVFAQFLMLSLQLCLILYQMVKHLDGILIVIVNCAFLTTILLQLFIYSYGGEILKFESTMVGIAVQLSRWYNLKPAYSRMLMLMMLRSQRESVIKAGTYVASLANFVAILQAAVSYIAILKSIE